MPDAGVSGLPEPLDKAPALESINGIGLRLMGRRNAAEDGSYTATRYFTFLFVPLIPIDAFRVADAEDGGTYFLGKVPLAEGASWWQRAAVAGALAAVLGIASWAYWSSPTRRLAQALGEARAAEEQAASPQAREAVVAEYERVVHEFAAEVPADELGDAAASLVRLLADDVDADFALDDVNHALRIVRRVEALPAEVVAAGAGPALARRLADWAGALAGDGASVRGAIQLLDEAERLSPGAGLDLKRIELSRRLGDALAAEWPLEAVHVYVGLDEPEATAKAGAIMTGLEEASAIWLQLADDVERWAVAAGEPQASLATELRQRVEAARAHEAGETRAQLLESSDPAGLRRAHAADPGDQGVASALAQTLRAAGRSDAALEVMESLGRPGVLAREAQITLASAWSDLGRVADARDLLSRVFESRLPEYEALRRRYARRATDLQDQLIERAQRGDLPPDLSSRLDGKPEEEQGQIFSEWLVQQLDEDPELQQLSAAYEGFSDVVPAALSLGGLTLQLAGEADGDERSRLLAAAERIFLAIQGDAQGVPSYHLGLGQVYHRLGKAEQGEQELASVLATGDDWLALAVADVYRDLGMLGRAREVNVEVSERASGDARQQAVIALAVTAATLDDSERWYRQADPEHPFVKHNLLQIEGDRLAAQGAFAEADAKFAQVFEWEVQRAEVDSTAANNAALTSMRRYGCTGDLDHLDRAVELMERGLRLAPDSALLMTNHSQLVSQRGLVRVLARWLDPHLLRLSGGQASAIVNSMLDGPQHDAVLEALLQDSDLRRGRELARQQQLLGPHRPDGYVQELGWYLWREDLEKLRDLKARVEGAGGIDTSRTAKQIEVRLSGEKDAENRDDLAGQLAAIRARRAALPQGTGASTVAVSWLLESQAEDNLAEIDGLPNARTAVEALRQARAAWPGIGATRSLAASLVKLAVLEAAETEPALQQAWAQSYRRLGINLTLNQLMDQQAAVADALRARPELAEAVELLLPISVRRPALQDHVVGRLTGNDELSAAGRRLFDRELSRLEAELQVLLDASEASVAYLALFEQGRDRRS